MNAYKAGDTPGANKAHCPEMVTVHRLRQQPEPARKAAVEREATALGDEPTEPLSRTPARCAFAA
jgi:hypothetical protein